MFQSCIFNFSPDTERGIFDAIIEGEIDFESPPWPSISNSAKDLIKKMLTQDPKKRITSAQVLRTYASCYICNLNYLVQVFGNHGAAMHVFSEHPWLKEGGEASDKPIDSAVLSRMKQFRAMNKLKKMALKVGRRSTCIRTAPN